jgi:hypothetical protein
LPDDINAVIEYLEHKYSMSVFGVAGPALESLSIRRTC